MLPPKLVSGRPNGHGPLFCPNGRLTKQTGEEVVRPGTGRGRRPLGWPGNIENLYPMVARPTDNTLDLSRHIRLGTDVNYANRPPVQGGGLLRPIGPRVRVQVAPR